MDPSPPPTGPDITVISPAHNERDNLAPLVEELRAVMEPLGRSYEIIIVDDGSTDGSEEVLKELMSDHAPLRILRLLETPSNRGNGQSAAFDAGFRAARGPVIATLDADRQNDPAEIPAMIDLLEREELDFVQGDRTGSRKDSSVRRATSVVSKWIRRVLLGDSIRDCACSLRVMRREVALRFPMEFRGMHRYMPIMACEMGLRVREIPVRHRPRVAGVAKYGIVNRAIPGLFDIFVVRWMRARRRPTGYLERTRTASVDAETAAATSGPVREMQRS